MMHTARKLVLIIAAMMVTSITCLAQDVNPPFTWQGDGVVSVIADGGVKDVDFKFELAIDEYGSVSGQTSNEDGTSRIKHVFYSEKKQSDWPGFFSRKIVIVLMLNEHGNNPMLSVINGRILVDKFIYGETLITKYEQGNSIATALNVNYPEATLIENDDLPYDLESALNKCLPIGSAKIVGDYKKEHEPISLFNGKDLDGWQTFLKDKDVDPKSVWSVKDGAISCTGKPFGYLRTKEKYSDFKLSLQWKWSGKPTNSGVLLRISTADKVWPLCMEAQLKNQQAGDFVAMGCDFNENTSGTDSFFRVSSRKHDSSEYKPGEWNTYEITCKSGTIELTVNGKPQNKATGVSVTNGYIGLQSEGGPIMFRNIKLTPLTN